MVAKGKTSSGRGAEEVPERQRRLGRDEVRRRLLEAAYGVFAEKGYEGASLERVAEAAGFSKGAVYSNFAGKDELFFELVSARIDERIEASRAAASGRGRKGGVSSAARRAGDALGIIGEADPDWQKLFIEFWLRCARSEELRARLAEKRRVMRTRIAAGFEAEAASTGIELGRGEAMKLATAVLALSNGLGIEFIIDPEAVKPGLFGDLLSRLLAPPAVRKPSAKA